jgi:hypothetical protein
MSVQLFAMINLQKIELGAKGHWEYIIGLPLFLEPVATTLIWAQENTDKPSNVMQYITRGFANKAFW